MSLTFEFNLDSVNVNQQTNYLGQRSHSSKVTIRTHRHTQSIALSAPLKLSVIFTHEFITRIETMNDVWRCVPSCMRLSQIVTFQTPKPTYQLSHITLWSSYLSWNFLTASFSS